MIRSFPRSRSNHRSHCAVACPKNHSLHFATPSRKSLEKKCNCDSAMEESNQAIRQAHLSAFKLSSFTRSRPWSLSSDPTHLTFLFMVVLTGKVFYFSAGCRLNFSFLSSSKVHPVLTSFFVNPLRLFQYFHSSFRKMIPTYFEIAAGEWKAVRCYF